jgi:hypothetical protein
MPACCLPCGRPARPGCGVSPCFQALGRDRPPAARGDVLLPRCRRGRSAPLCAPLRPSAGFSACYGISIAPHGLRPSWAALRGCEGIQAYKHKRTPAGCEPVRGFVRYNQRKRGRLWCFQ